MVRAASFGNPAAARITGSVFKQRTTMYSPPEVNTQYDQQATQTQVMDDMPDDETTNEEDQCWGQLVSRSVDGPHFNLQRLPPDEQGRHNVHLIGRSTACALQLTSSPRISNKHCVIYCKQNIADPHNPRLEAWIEDLSANGTFINGETRLTKNVPRLLHHRDEIFLVNPEFKRMAKAGTKILEDIAQNSFVVMLNLPSPVDEFIRASRDYEMQLSQNEASQGAHLDRANTVNRLLGQNRCIYDHYEIKTLLGEGTSGSVYHGINKETGRDWAVKIIPTKNLNLLASVINNKGRNSNLNGNELTKEAELLRSLRHPHIIHLEDIFADNRRLFLVMEMSSGGDLFDRVVKKKHYPEHEAKIVMTQILQAMAYLHEKNIAHRDIKPENILLVSKHSDVDIKLTDFGLAKKVDESGKMKTFCGTPQYFAPEVLQRRHTTKGSGTYSLAADMWSIGVIMFVLLEGNYPFNENTLSQQITSAQYSFAAPVWGRVSSEAKDVIRQLLVVDPNARLTAMQALACPWFTMPAGAQAIAAPSAASLSVAPAAPDAAPKGRAASHSMSAAARIDGEEDAAGRSETMSTMISDGANGAASNNVSPRADETNGGGLPPATNGNTAGAVHTADSAASAAGDEFNGTACMSITTAVQFELERVTLDSEAAAAKKGTAKRVVAASASATGKRKLATEAAAVTPTRGADKRSRGSAKPESASKEKEGRTMRDFYPRQSPSGSSATASVAGSAAGGHLTRRVTRSASTLG